MRGKREPGTFRDPFLPPGLSSVPKPESSGVGSGFAFHPLVFFFWGGRWDLGKGMVFLAAFESPREVSRALPSPGHRVQLSGSGDTRSPALLQALLAAAGRAGDGRVIECRVGVGDTTSWWTDRGGDRRQALGDPFPWALEIVRPGLGGGCQTRE